MSTYTVWKYTIDPRQINDSNEVVVEMPPGAQIIHVGSQRLHPMDEERVRIWAKINLDDKGALCRRKFVVLGTGMEYIHEDRNPLSQLMVHIGTVQMMSGLVFHVFELRDY